MVALRGSNWNLAPSLIVLHNQINAAWPTRNKSSDGSIGDAAHSARVSDHNPDGSGVVRALDTDEDLDGPSRGQEQTRRVVEALRTSHDRRIKYVIYEGRLFASYSQPWRPAWEWGPYSGINDHAHHWHLSILGSREAAESQDPWPILGPVEEGAIEVSIKEGDSGRTVRAIKKCYNGFHRATGVGRAVDVTDDDYGPAMKSLIREFQQWSDLPVSGVVDGVTFAALTRWETVAADDPEEVRVPPHFHKVSLTGQTETA